MLVSRSKNARPRDKKIIGMERALPGAQNRRNGERGIQAVEVPEDATDAAGDNDAIGAAAGLLAAVTDYRVALRVADAVEVGGLVLFALLLPVPAVSMLKTITQ